MRVRYNQGDPLKPEDLNKRRIMASLNQPERSDDPIARRLEEERFAQEHSNMMEEAYDQYIVPDSRETGQVNPDRPYLLDAALAFSGGPAAARSVLGKAAGQTAGKVATRRGGIAEIDALRREAIEGLSKRLGEKRMLNEQQKRIAEDRLQYLSDRLLNDAKTADMADNLNLQGHLTDILEATIKGEKDKVNKILMNLTDDAANRRMVSDELNALAESLSGRSGGIVDEFRNVPPSKLDEFMGRTGSMTEYLANPAKFDRVAGYPRLPFDITKPASRNEYGGIVKKQS